MSVYARKGKELFQFTPLREGRLPPRWKAFATVRFQFTPLREGRLSVVQRSAHILYFNSRPCERGDAGLEAIAKNLIAISIHAPARGATQLFRLPGKAGPFQFTPLREGRRHGRQLCRLPRKFQFTPLREGRHTGPSSTRVSGCYFNSRPCERGDQNLGKFYSAHTHFNSRPCERGDGRNRRGCGCRSRNFNSRPCERGDLRRQILCHRRYHFNSRPCERGDLISINVIHLSFVISIHAPARGATPAVPAGNDGRLISIHAPARGATRPAGCSLLVIGVQFTPLREGRQSRLPGSRPPWYFNSRPCERGDIHHYFILIINLKFQFTPLREGRQEVRESLRQKSKFQFTPLREGRRG